MKSFTYLKIITISIFLMTGGCNKIVSKLNDLNDMGDNFKDPENSFPDPIYEEVIPNNRKINWKENVGVEGGIPNRTNIRNCVTSDGVRADGTNASLLIQDCINNTPSDGVSYLPEGVYTLQSGISIGSNKTLRGSGAESTVLLAGDMANVVTFGQQYANRSPIDIVSGYIKGSDELVLENAESISVNSFLRVDELNDSTVPVTESGYGKCTWCGREQGTRVRGQIVKVLAKNGNSIKIKPEMYFNFSKSNNPQVQPLGGPNGGMIAQYSGIENLTIKNQGSAYTTKRIPLNVYLTANCWAKNIKIENCGTRCVKLFYNNYRFELRDSIISGCISDRYDSNDCYGTLIGMYNSGILIENNIYEFLADGPMFAWGASGNVVGYNYIYDAHRTKNMETWFNAIGAAHHGAHTAFNLWEGNVFESAYFDQYWGSHSHNTLFRNRILGKYSIDGIAKEESIQNVFAIATEKNNHYQNYLGNVLGTLGYHNKYERNAEGCGSLAKLIYRTGYISSGSCDSSPETFNTMFRHMNYDYVTESVKYCGDEDEPPCPTEKIVKQLPRSQYLSSKPTWFGNVPWPPIGPDVNGYYNKIPAELRQKK